MYWKWEVISLSPSIRSPSCAMLPDPFTQMQRQHTRMVYMPPACCRDTGVGSQHCAMGHSVIPVYFSP